MLAVLVVGLGGFVGAAARYGVTRLLVERGWATAAGTLSVNTIGCLLLGALIGMGENRPGLSESTRLFLTVGILGSFTTFSALSSDVLGLFGSRGVAYGLRTLGWHVGLGLGALWVGRIIARALFR